MEDAAAESDAALPPSPKRPRRTLDLTGSAACFHAIHGDGDPDDLSVGKRLGALGIVLRQETDTPVGEMILYRFEEDKAVDLGSFSAAAALAALQAGRFTPAEPKRRHRAA